MVPICVGVHVHVHVRAYVLLCVSCEAKCNDPTELAHLSHCQTEVVVYIVDLQCFPVSLCFSLLLS